MLCEVYRCFYNKDGKCFYDESPLQPVSSKACYDYDEEYNNRYNIKKEVVYAQNHS